MLMLIAPSKTQHIPADSWGEATRPDLLTEGEVLIAILKEYSVEELGILMKMSASLALRTHERIHAFQTPFTLQNAKQALTVFQGDVYSRIESNGYTEKEQDYLQNHLRILSGLYGVLRPMDLMQTYRLEMGCKLPNGRGKSLYEFWGDLPTVLLNDTLASHKEAILVNLASVEYIRVIKKKQLQGHILQVDFKEQKGDSYKTVAIHAKRARGMMVDFAVKENVESVRALQGFRREGYRFQKDMSTEMHYVFTRKI